MIGLGFGFHGHGEAMQVSEFRKVFQGAIITNVGYTKETGEQVVEAGDADIVAYGRPYISNPDLVERFKAGADLNPDADVSVWYSKQAAPEVGFTDFPTISS